MLRPCPECKARGLQLGDELPALRFSSPRAQEPRHMPSLRDSGPSRGTSARHGQPLLSDLQAAGHGPAGSKDVLRRLRDFRPGSTHCIGVDCFLRVLQVRPHRLALTSRCRGPGPPRGLGCTHRVVPSRPRAPGVSRQPRTRRIETPHLAQLGGPTSSAPPGLNGPPQLVGVLGWIAVVFGAVVFTLMMTAMLDKLRSRGRPLAARSDIDMIAWLGFQFASIILGMTALLRAAELPESCAAERPGKSRLIGLRRSGGNRAACTTSALRRIHPAAGLDDEADSR